MKTQSTNSEPIHRMVSTLSAKAIDKTSWARANPPKLPANRALDLFALYGHGQVQKLQSILS